MNTEDTERQQRAHAHYIISAAKNTVTQYLKFPLSCYPPRRSTLGFGLMTYRGQEKPSGDMSSITKRWKRRWVGGRGEEMVEDMGGGGLEEGDFAGPRHFVRELPKGRVEMLEERRKYDRPISAHQSVFISLTCDRAETAKTWASQPYLASSWGKKCKRWLIGPVKYNKNRRLNLFSLVGWEGITDLF